MAEIPSGSGLPTPKAIGSLAKRQSDVTRQGTQKLKFVPTLPQRRKKEEVKAEPTPSAVPSASRHGRGRGRGRGRGGLPIIEMTASGPFAMGPAMAGSTSRRSTPRSNFAPSVATSTSASGSTLGTGLSHTVPSLKKYVDSKGKGKIDKVDDDEGEVYSDADEGVEIIDIDKVRQMDWMAPESLPKPKKLKIVKKVKESDEGSDADITNAATVSDNEDEDEVELESIIEDFAAQASDDIDPSLREERLYLFQFPSPFPTFMRDPAPSSPRGDVEMRDETGRVAVVPDFKSTIGSSSVSSRMPSTVPSEPQKDGILDGVIGRLEVYQSGTVKMRLGNGILLDVTSATQPSFLQQVVCLDMNERRLKVIGEVNKQFIVSPNVEMLLEALEEADKAPAPQLVKGEEKLIKMSGN